MNEVILNEITMTSTMVFTMSVIGIVLVRRLPRSERLVPYLSLIAHMFVGVVLLAIMDYVFVVADVHYYFDAGGKLAHLMRLDFARWAPEIVKFTLQQDSDLGMYFPGEFSNEYSTTSMAGSVSFLLLMLNDSQYASFVFMAGLAFASKLAAYSGMRIMMPRMDPQRVAIAMMLVPSAVFWSSGVVKESWATIGLGLMTLWLARVSQGSLASSPHLLLLGIPPIALIKPYLLFPLTLATGVWYLLTRERQTHVTMRPLVLLTGSLVVAVAMVVLSTAFPEFSFDELGSSTSNLQQAGARTRGGSNYSLGNANETTLKGQLLFAPLALVTVLMRPFPFEVHNFTASLASLEVTVLMILFFTLLRRNSFRDILTVVRRSPPLAYCLVFMLVAGLAIGLATSNFGTLSRYRIPMMPYYVLFVLVLIDRKSGVAAMFPRGVDAQKNASVSPSAAA